MSDDTIISMIWLVGGLTLVSGGLVHRRLGGRRAITLALVWLAIILAAWGGVVLIGHHRL